MLAVFVNSYNNYECTDTYENYMLILVSKSRPIITTFTNNIERKN